YFEIALKALLDRRRVAGHGLVRHKSTTFTAMKPSLHGLLWPLMHLIRYLLPQAAPLSHNPSLAATKKPPSGNWVWSYPLHFVALLYHEAITKVNRKSGRSSGS
ncbi:hypothetical protein CRG98_003937, partial [Punica granatum]